MKRAIDLKLHDVSTLKPKMTILSEFQFLFQNDVDVTVVDHGQLNIIHVLASVAHVDPDLIENVIDFYLWLKTSLDIKVLEILLKMRSSQTYNALELSVHLGVFRLATEILNTEGIYVIIRHVGPFEYRAFDITEYEFVLRKPFTLFPLIGMIDSVDIKRQEAQTFFENEPVSLWIKTRGSFLKPFIALWFLIRIIFVFTLISFTEVSLLETSNNSLKCPSMYNIPKDYQFSTKILMSCILFFLCLCFLFYDIATIGSACCTVDLKGLLATPNKTKTPSLYPLFSRMLQFVVALLSISYTTLTLVGVSVEEYCQLFIMIILMFLFWQILYFAQFIPSLGYCVLTLFHMMIDLSSLMVIIGVFIIQQAYLLRIILNPCPEEFKSFLHIMNELSLDLMTNSKTTYESHFGTAMSIWRFEFCTLGAVLIMNFVIAVFSNTISVTTSTKNTMMKIQHMYTLHQVAVMAELFLKSFYWKRHRKFFDYVNGRIYITSERLMKKQKYYLNKDDVTGNLSISGDDRFSFRKSSYIQAHGQWKLTS